MTTNTEEDVKYVQIYTSKDLPIIGSKYEILNQLECLPLKPEPGQVLYVSRYMWMTLAASPHFLCKYLPATYLQMIGGMLGTYNGWCLVTDMMGEGQPRGAFELRPKLDNIAAKFGLRQDYLYIATTRKAEAA